jgi:YidC/Oxa1 family membrane protein insertase
MDFGVGFISNNVMLPILDFFYGIVPSYGLAIIFLTLVIRLGLYPLNANSIRNMRQMRVAQPVMQKRMKEVQEKYQNDPEKQREVQAELYKEFGNPLGGCLPLFVQMPVLFALFATLRGSPFADVPFDVNLQILPSEIAAEVLPAPFTTTPKNIFLSDAVHQQVVLTAPAGKKLAVGSRTQLQLQNVLGRSFEDLREEFATSNEVDLTPTWKVTKGQERVQIKDDGTLLALEPGDVTVQASIPGLAANTGFLFIEELGRVGARGEDGTIHWDIVGMVIAFGLSTYLSQSLAGQGPGSSNPDQNSVNKITPILFSAMFLFFPLPAGVLIYIVISNIFQTAQTYFLSKEPLPENLQKLVEQERVREEKAKRGDRKTAKEGRDSLPFER